MLSTVMFYFDILCFCPVQYHSLLCGRTLGFHIDILKQVKVPTMEVSLDECKVVLVFCPMASRAGTDIAAALKNVPGKRFSPFPLL